MFPSSWKRGAPWGSGSLSSAHGVSPALRRALGLHPSLVSPPSPALPAPPSGVPTQSSHTDAVTVHWLSPCRAGTQSGFNERMRSARSVPAWAACIPGPLPASILSRRACRAPSGVPGKHPSPFSAGLTCSPPSCLPGDVLGFSAVTVRSSVPTAWSERGL